MDIVLTITLRTNAKSFDPIKEEVVDFLNSMEDITGDDVAVGTIKYVIK